jgi:hypothetical protein
MLAGDPQPFLAKQTLHGWDACLMETAKQFLQLDLMFKKMFDGMEYIRLHMFFCYSLQLYPMTVSTISVIKGVLLKKCREVAYIY